MGEPMGPSLRGALLEEVPPLGGPPCKCRGRGTGGGRGRAETAVEADAASEEQKQWRKQRRVVGAEKERELEWKRSREGARATGDAMAEEKADARQRPQTRTVFTATNGDPKVAPPTVRGTTSGSPNEDC